MSKLYNKLFGVDPRVSKQQELTQLYKQPEKESGHRMPRYQPQRPNMLHQADLLFLPNDKGYRYLLVVVDVGTRMVDAIPLKSKQSSHVFDALHTIYTRPNGPLIYPRRLEVDSGGEFKGIFLQQLLKKNVFVKVAMPARHRQVAIVERKNQTIGDILHKRMAAQELLTGQTSTQWVEIVPKVIQAMNEEAKEWKPKPFIE